MRINKMCVLLVLAVLVQSVMHAQRQSAPTVQPWIASVVIEHTGSDSVQADSRLLRIGLKNNTETARLICVADLGYSIQNSGHMSGKAEGGVHSCRTSESFTLVLASETYFMAVAVEPADLMFDDAAIEITLRLFEFSPDVRSSLRQVPLTWRGSVRDGLQVWKQLNR